jgi:hypothetical protein
MPLTAPLTRALALLLIAGTAHAAPSLDRVLDLAKSKGYRSRHVDWDRVGQEARTLEASKGEDAAIRFVIAALGDKHTSYKAPVPPVSKPSAIPAASTEATTTPIAAVQAPVDAMPVVQIHHWLGKDPAGATQTVRSALSQALADRPCGLILDFSSNSGGNMWPMLVGLSPLLSDGPLGAFRAADGTISPIVKFDGLIVVDGHTHPLNYPLALTPPAAVAAIAIVIGPQSASSGEITPLMFYGQKNVRFFGRKTAGFTSGNQVFPLPNGGTLILTTSMTQDRNGHEHPDGIEPDVASSRPREEGSAWLKQQCARP